MSSVEDAQKRRLRRPWVKYVPVIVTVVVGVAMSVAAWGFVGNVEKERVQVEFAIAANNRSALIRQSLESEVDRLDAFRNLYARSGRLGRSEFNDFARTLLRTEPSLQAIEWVPRVEGAQRAEYEQAARQAGMKDFQFIVMNDKGKRVRAPEEKEYFPVYFVAPGKQVPAVAGFDLASSPERLDALHRARDEGRTVLVSDRRIGEDNGAPYSVLVHLPVYAGNTMPATVEARRRDLEGFVVGTLRVPALVEQGIASLYLRGVDVYVYDMTPRGAGRLLYHHVDLASKGDSPIKPDPIIRKLPLLADTVEVGGDRWRVVSKAVPGFVVLQRPRAPYATIILFGGLAFTALASGYFLNNIFRERQTERLIAQRTGELREGERQLRRDTERLEELVAERTREIREARRKYEGLVQNIPQAVYSLEVGPPRKVTFMSERVGDLAGVDPRTVCADPGAWEDRIHPEDRRRVMAALDEATAGLHSFACEYRLVHKLSGQTRHVVDHSTAIRDESGKVVRFDGTILDVTERWQEAEERRRLEAQVQHAQKLESLGVLAGGIAHDFNNMLVAILGNADLALMELGDYSPVRRSVEEIKRASIRASELTNQMLAYSGRGRFLVERVDLNELIREMGQLLNVSISKRAKLQFDLTDHLPAVEADVTQIRQVVLNLITNASEALASDEGTITVRTQPVQADRQTLSETYLGEDLPEGQYVLMEVSDTGCGMDEQTRERIFDPFFSTKFTGRGLGLAAVLGIVRGHGGTIRVRSAPGEGTTFSVLLPGVGPVQHVEPPRPMPPAKIPSPTGAILVVDDEKAVRDLARTMLARHGLEVLTAADGREGVEVFAAHADEIAAVLLDLTMPVMGGQEAWRKIRAIRPDVPVILCSGYGEQEATQQFAGEGLAGFLHKPFEIDALLARLGAVMQKA